jgi:hypothetical protein
MQSFEDLGRMLLPATVPTNITSIRRSIERFIDMALPPSLSCGLVHDVKFPAGKRALFYFRSLWVRSGKRVASPPANKPKVSRLYRTIR